jgi:bifunctional ADP-heptose synthase (sugar kinase/adenylyltransferase)
MAALESVSLVTWFDEGTQLELITALLPDILVKGGDYDLNLWPRRLWSKAMAARRWQFLLSMGIRRRRW